MRLEDIENAVKGVSLQKTDHIGKQGQLIAELARHRLHFERSLDTAKRGLEPFLSHPGYAQDRDTVDEQLQRLYGEEPHFFAKHFARVGCSGPVRGNYRAGLHCMTFVGVSELARVRSQHPNAVCLVYFGSMGYFDERPGAFAGGSRGSNPGEGFPDGTSFKTVHSMMLTFIYQLLTSQYKFDDERIWSWGLGEKSLSDMRAHGKCAFLLHLLHQLPQDAEVFCLVDGSNLSLESVPHHEDLLWEVLKRIAALGEEPTIPAKFHMLETLHYMSRW